MSNPSKQKGTTAENAVVFALLEAFPHREVERRTLAGAYDKGDIWIPGMPVVIEVKNHARMDLATWVAECEKERLNARAEIGAVWHKRRGKGHPRDWYVTLLGQDFMTLLRKAYP
jgi:hypothetical protein